jgi:hypothetical protein
MAAQQSMGMQPGPQYGIQGYPPQAQQGNQGGLFILFNIHLPFSKHFID